MATIPTIAINANTASVTIKPGQTQTFGLGSLFVYLPGDDPTTYGAVLRLAPSGSNYTFDGAADVFGNHDYVIFGDVTGVISNSPTVTSVTFTNTSSVDVAASTIAANLLAGAHLQYEHTIINPNTGLPQGFTDQGNISGALVVPPNSLAISISDADPVFATPTGTEQANFIVSLSAPSQDTITVQYKTQDDTAHAGTDYQAQSGTLTFVPGLTTQTISIPVINHNLAQHNENFTVVLSNPTDSNGTTPTITGGIGKGTIDALFTDSADSVNFNNLTDSQKQAIDAGADLYNSFGGDDVVTLPSANNYNDLKWDDTRTFVVGNGNDKIFGGDGNYNIQLGSGTDSVSIDGNGDSIITLGSGFDTITITGDGNNIINAGTGTVNLSIDGDPDVFNGNLVGTVSLSDNASLIVTGNLQGTVTIDSQSTLELEAAAEATIDLRDASTLQIDNKKMPQVTITGFNPGDAIDLREVPFNDSTTYSIFETNNNVLQVVSNGISYDLRLDPNQVFNGGFEVVNDGQGGTEVQFVDAPVTDYSKSPGKPVAPPLSAPFNPYGAVVQIFEEASGGALVGEGTGFIIGPHTILTAAHVLFNPSPAGLIAKPSVFIGDHAQAQNLVGLGPSSIFIDQKYQNSFANGPITTDGETHDFGGSIPLRTCRSMECFS
jgi:Calx-beta domain